MEEEKKANEEFLSDDALSDEQLEQVSGGAKPTYMYCRKCGKGMDGGAVKCPYCGSTDLYLSSGLD